MVKQKKKTHPVVESSYKKASALSNKKIKEKKKEHAVMRYLKYCATYSADRLWLTSFAVFMKI